MSRRNRSYDHRYPDPPGQRVFARYLKLLSKEQRKRRKARRGKKP